MSIFCNFYPRIYYKIAKFSLVLLLFIPIFANAQGDEMTTIKGKVTTSGNQPVEFATIMLINKADLQTSAGTTTDLDGKFELTSNISDFILEVSFIGFQTLRLDDLSPTGPIMDLGTIILLADQKMLDEVVVSTERSTMEFKLDKRVFNVGSDLSSTGASALELLTNIPSVSVNIEGQISLRGSQGVQILINGKPSVLASSENNALGSITADMIERVEVITNPSAKYEAEGTSGIINIVLKKEEKKGLNGSVSINTGIPDNHSIGISLNRRTEKFNLFSQLGAGYRSMPRENRNINQNFESGTIIRSTGLEYRNEYYYTVILGTDYHFSPSSVLTLSGNFTYEVEDQPSSTNFEFLDNTEAILGDWGRVETTHAVNPKWQYDLQYKKIFAGNEDHHLLLSTQGNYFGKEQSSEFSNTTFSGSRPDGTQMTNTNFGEARYYFNVDYTLPLSKEVTIEAGSQYVFNDVSNDFAVSDFIASNWVENPDFTNVFEWQQGVLGVYGTAAYEGSRWGLKLGLRMEQTELNTRLINTNETNNRNFTNLFPSAHTSYKFSEKFSTQIGYSRRIFRPRLWDLNPFFNIRNDFAIRTGNPDLQPQFTDAYEFTGIYISDKWSLNAGVYYRYTTDVVERVLTIQDNVSFTRPENIGTDGTTGSEINFKYTPVSWLSFNGDFNYNFFSQRGEFEGTSFDFDAQRWFSRLMTSLKLPHDLDAEFSWDHQSGYKNFQQTIASNYAFNIGVRKKILKGKAILSASVRDLFATRIQETFTNQPDFYIYNWSRRGRFLTLGFSYGFGKGEAMEFSGQRRH